MELVRRLLKHLSPATQLYALVVVLRVAFYLGVFGARAMDITIPAVSAIEIGLLVAHCVIGLFWLHGAWRRIPESCRKAYDDRQVEPGEAIIRLFLPIYGLYWLFIANVGLCSAIERHALEAGLRRKGPSRLAMVACLVQLVPLVGLFAGPLFWFPFMVRVDLLDAEIKANA